MGVSRLIQSGDTIEPNEFEFTYTGDYNYKEGASGTIEIEFLTSGTFTLLKSSPFKPFDLCLVGGGGNGGGGSNSYSSGGGGGYVENFYDIPVELNKAYPIVIGGSAGDTTGFGYIAKAGKPGSSGRSSAFRGGDGGSGGGAGYEDSTYWIGVSGNSQRYSNIYSVGKGQGKTTRAFGTGKLFGGGGGGNFGAGGSDGSDGVVEVTNNKDQPYKQYGGNGGGGTYSSNQNTTYQNGETNTGGGGGGGYYVSGKGGSGIAILRRRWSETIPVVDNNKNLEVKSYTINY